MAGTDPRDTREIVLDGQVVTVTAERAIRCKAEGQMFLEWTNVPRAHIQDVIDKSAAGPDGYEIMVRWVTEWQVER